MPLDGDVKQFETETKPDVFSLEGLRDWLKTQDPNEGYVWENCRGGCLLGLYLIAHGYNMEHYIKLAKTPTHERLPERISLGLSYEITDVGRIAMRRPHAFGAALSRCEAAIKSRT
jgi:hypothetical protein